MKSGYAAIIGEPNVGKSTLLNRLLGVKLSIVSARPQTTRHRILGILTEPEGQCVFIDTPGLINPAYALQEAMADQIHSALEDADVLIWMTGLWANPGRLPAELVQSVRERPAVAVINKIDLFPKNRLLPFLEQMRDLPFQEIIPISALNGEGVDRLKQAIFKYLPEAEALYPAEDLSDRPERFFVAEMIRERIFQMFHKEIPYSTCVVIEEFREREKGKYFIRAVIYVERVSQRAIIIGKSGQSLKRLGAAVRPEIESFIDHPVFLELWVKVREKWRQDKKFLKEIGY